MKKISILALALSACLASNADTSLKMLTFGSQGGPGVGEPGMMGLGISPNGKYVCGTIEGGMGIFIGNLETDEMLFNATDDEGGGQLLSINNEGIGIGFEGETGITCNVDGEKTPLFVPEGFKYIIGQDISVDGSVQVGLMVGEGFQIYPGYAKDGGLWQTLPLPEADLDFYNTKQVGARYVSSDGKLILGNIGYLGPATLWRLNENGEYIPDPIFEKYAMRSREDTEHPYFRFTPEGMSPDGHYVLIEVTRYVDGLETPSQAAIYDTETNELKVFTEEQKIDDGGYGLHPTAIANNGTFIGMLGAPTLNQGAFIMYAGETQAEMYTQAFPKYEKVFALLDLAGYHDPADISADGRYILGNGWYCSDDDYESPASIFYFATYVIDTQAPESGVQTIESGLNDAVSVDCYTIDGLRTATPVKGINIIRMSDGSVRKVLK